MSDPRRDTRRSARDKADLPVDPDVPERPSHVAGGRAMHGLVERWDILLVIAAGGSLGSLARYVLNRAMPHTDDGIAWGTWLENVSGALLLGILMVFVLDVWPTTRYLRPFLAVGVLGGFTTFSTYMLDTHALMDNGKLPAAFGYVFGTLLTGLLAVWAGILLARASVMAIDRRHLRRRARMRSAGVSDPGAPPGRDRDPDQDLEPDHDPADEPRRQR